MARRGERLSAETRAKISEALIRNFKSSLRERIAEPLTKRCARCNKVKSVEEFTQVRHKLKSGLVAVHPHSPCKKCKAEQTKAYRERLAAEGVDLRARQRRYEANEDVEKRRRRRREWAAAKRREEGKPVRGPYKRNASSTPQVSTRPIARFLRGRLENESKADISALTGVEVRRLFSIQQEEYPSVSLEIVDALLTGLGCPDELQALYPLESEMVGYQVLDPLGVLQSAETGP
jgi:hypothetical protein